MGHPEKEPENKPDLNNPPKLDAIFPDDPPPSAAELIDDFDDYQKKLEKEWESTKSSYEQKINGIMEEFLKEGVRNVASGPEEKPAPPPPPPPKHAPHTDEPKPFSSWKQNPGRDARLSDLMSHLEKELRRAGQSKQASFLPGNAPQTMQLGWEGSRRHRWKLAAKILIPVFLIGSFAGWLFVSRMVRVTTLPYAHTLGPIVQNGRVYIMDWFRKSLYVHADKQGLPILAVENIPNSYATGFALSDKMLWTLEGLEQKILLHNVTPDHQITSAIATPSSKPVGLFYDGTDLWSLDQDAKRIYRHRGNDVEDIRDVFPLPEANANALALYKNRLWLLDGKARLMYVYRLQKPCLQLGMFDLDPFVKGATPTGFAFNGKRILMVTENPPQLLSIPLSRLKKSKTETY